MLSHDINERISKQFQNFSNLSLHFNYFCLIKWEILQKFHSKSWNFLPQEFYFNSQRTSCSFLFLLNPLKLSISQTERKLFYNFSSFVSHKNGFFNQISFFLYIFYRLDENLQFWKLTSLDEFVENKKKLKGKRKNWKKNA
jgi:hypothetical protein